MAVNFSSGTNKRIDTSVQAVKENQIVVLHDAGSSRTRFVVYRVAYRRDGYIYHLINLETGTFITTDLVRPLHEKFGTGMYYNALAPEFMDSFEVLVLQSEAEDKEKAEQEARQTEQEHGEHNQYIERYAPVAGDEANICIKVQTDKVETVSEAVTGDFIIVDYSEKALAVFGDTRPIKDQLMALGGRFNPKLLHNGGKSAGWIFSKSKENELRNMLNIK